jgi:hypothetical protein
MHQLSPDGMLVNDAFCDEDIKDPTAMCFNNDFTELYVADDSTGSFKGLPFCSEKVAL